MYFWQVISCNLFLNKNVKIAGKNCKIRKTFWCTVKVQWLTTSICWLSKGQWKYRGKWDAGKTCTFGSGNICCVEQKQCYHTIQVHLATARFNRFITLDLIVLQVSGANVTCSNSTPLAFNDLDLASVEREEKSWRDFWEFIRKP